MRNSTVQCSGARPRWTRLFRPAQAVALTLAALVLGFHLAAGPVRGAEADGSSSAPPPQASQENPAPAALPENGTGLRLSWGEISELNTQPSFTLSLYASSDRALTSYRLVIVYNPHFLRWIGGAQAGDNALARSLREERAGRLLAELQAADGTSALRLEGAALLSLRFQVLGAETSQLQIVEAEAKDENGRNLQLDTGLPKLLEITEERVADARSAYEDALDLDTPYWIRSGEEPDPKTGNFDRIARAAVSRLFALSAAAGLDPGGEETDAWPERPAPLPDLAEARASAEAGWTDEDEALRRAEAAKEASQKRLLNLAVPALAFVLLLILLLVTAPRLARLFRRDVPPRPQSGTEEAGIPELAAGASQAVESSGEESDRTQTDETEGTVEPQEERKDEVTRDA